MSYYKNILHRISARIIALQLYMRSIISFYFTTCWYYSHSPHSLPRHYGYYKHTNDLEKAACCCCLNLRYTAVSRWVEVIALFVLSRKVATSTKHPWEVCLSQHRGILHGHVIRHHSAGIPLIYTSIYRLKHSGMYPVQHQNYDDYRICIIHGQLPQLRRLTLN